MTRLNEIVKQIVPAGFVSSESENWFVIELNKDAHFIVGKRKLNKRKTNYVGEYFNDEQLEKEVKRRWNEVRGIYAKRGYY